MNYPSPKAIRSALEQVLPQVQKPSRYLGLERNQVRKGWDDVSVRMALTFPDAYEIGMSHQGSQILYHLVNRRDDALAERSFAPMPDMAAALGKAQLPLYTLESYRAVGEFDLVGISLQSELNYINVPYILDLARISRRASKRNESEPIVLGGGPCTANPEPIADFFDAILIGDGEAAIDQILDTVRDGRAAQEKRSTILQRLAAIQGVYVPALYSWHKATKNKPAQWEKKDVQAPFPISRVWVDCLDPADQPESVLVPFADVIQDRLGMEIMRGCTQGCRFCQAGYWYRPVREHDPEVVLERIERQVAETGFEEVGLLSLSTADYSQVEPLVSQLSDRLQDQRVSVSLPSLRADAFSVGLADAVSRVRKSGFTFAPETGSDRLRRVINKTFTNDEMVRAAEAAFSRGWNLIKIYAMIGLPTETDDDLEELAKLARELVRTGRRISNRRVEVKVSVGCFVPKAWTPFQWQPFPGVEELRRRIDLLKQRFRGIRGARLNWSDPEEAALETLLSRGSRELSVVIEKAHDLGAVFDGWSDHLNLESWRQALNESAVDLGSELGERSLGETLPWDHIDAGVRKGFLKAEWRRALRETETEDCKWGHCYRCGVPGNGDDTKLALASLPVLKKPQSGKDQAEPSCDQRNPEARPLPTIRHRAQPPLFRRYRFSFSKLGDARFLSHRQLMDAFERVLRAASLPVRFTEGFNPHIRLSMGPALAVGHQGDAEIFDVDCTAPVRAQHIEQANRLLPEGVRILDANPLLPGAPSLGKLIASSRFRVDPASDFGPWPNSCDGLPDDLKAGIKQWSLGEGGSLLIELNLRQEDGPTVSLKQLFLALGLHLEQIPKMRVTRESLLLSPRNKQTKTAGKSPGARV